MVGLRSPRSPCPSCSIAPMLAALWLLADAAEEGRNVVLSMLVVGLIFLAVIAVGEAAHAVAARRKADKANRPL